MNTAETFNQTIFPTLVFHNISSNHKFDFKHSNILTFINDKNKPRIIESSAISHL